VNQDLPPPIFQLTLLDFAEPILFGFRTILMSLDEPRPRLPAITSLRFFAAFHVALFHMKEIGVITGPEWLKSLAGIGYVGVSFFFVLSGFILVYTYAGRTMSLRNFWQARFARIYPAYLFSLVLSFPFFYFGALKMHVPFFAFAEHHFALASALVLTLLQSWVPPAALAWNSVAWSLSVEAFFYVVFPFALAKYSKLSRTALWIVIPACWAAGLAVSIAVLALRPAGAPYVNSADYSSAINFVKFFPLVRLPEFLMGMACGFLFLHSKRSPRLALPLVGLGLLGITATVIASRFVPYLVVHTALPGPAFAALVYGVALQPNWAKFLNLRPLVLFGDASYSFYLLHTFFVWPFFHDFKTQALRNQGFIGIGLWTVMMLAIASLVYRFIEEPARRKLRPHKRIMPAPVRVDEPVSAD
jgi:peptidoglycan/LPS O-acetylase OafA/YrhL